MTITNTADPRLYVQLMERLRRQIRDGEIPVGGAMPSVTVLTSETGYARQTCSKAMQQLEKEGVLVLVPGRGYHAAPSSQAS